MKPLFQSVQLFLLAGAAFLLIGSLAAAGLVRVFGKRIVDSEPHARHRELVLIALLPILTSISLLFSATLPSLLALGFPGLDHCATHDDVHAHLCFVHLPKLSMNAGIALGLVFFSSCILVRSARSAMGLLRARRLLRVLAQTGRRNADLGVTIIDSDDPVCFAAGLLRPQVFMSRALLDSLDVDKRAIVLAHEQAHVRRRDALMTSVVRACTIFHLPHVGRWLIREQQIAAEQSCDEESAAVAGDRVAVAEVILAVERAAQCAASSKLGAMAVAFGDCAVKRRIEALLSEPLPAASPWPLQLGAALAAVALLLTANILHHETETVLSLLTH